MRSLLLILLSIFFLQALGLGQTAHKLLRKGNKFYNVDEYNLAENSYRKALEKDKTSKTSYNLGNSIYNQERYEEAIQHFQNSVASLETKEDQAKAYHNLGNSYFENKQLEEAVEAYKQSIRLNPDDAETMHNLLITKEIMKVAQQQEQQQQQNQDGEQQDGEQQEGEQQEQQEQQQQDQQEGDEGENQSEQESQQDSTDISQGGSFDSTRLQKQNLDSLDAVKLLQIIESEEKKVQEKLRKFNSNRKKQDKDW